MISLVLQITDGQIISVELLQHYVAGDKESLCYRFTYKSKVTALSLEDTNYYQNVIRKTLQDVFKIKMR